MRLTNIYNLETASVGPVVERDFFHDDGWFNFCEKYFEEFLKIKSIPKFHFLVTFANLYKFIHNLLPKYTHILISSLIHCILLICNTISVIEI